MDDLIRLANSLREHAEWARANEWEAPITLSDDLEAAACLIGGDLEWARVEDELPLCVGDYLCMLAGTHQMAVLLFDTYLASWEDSDGTEYSVTHWMPLPEPPDIEEVE